MIKKTYYIYGVVLSLILFSFQANAQVSADFRNSGALKIGQSTTPCDSSTKGGIRYNATDKTMEYCNETEWVTIGGAAPTPLSVADVFSTDLYTGNGSTQTITNGIDLAGQGGMVWTKNRSGSGDHNLFNTRSSQPYYYLRSNTTEAISTSNNSRLTSFESYGFTLGADNPNWSGNNYVAWTFREAPKFFDIVTYTGDGISGRQIAHGLGVEPGMIVVKRYDSSGNWMVHHRSVGVGQTLYLHTTGAAFTEASITATNASNFTVGTTADVNFSGATYVAYLFAHDDSADGVIQCGSYTGNGSSSGPTVNVGWEPQWLMTKNASLTSDWIIHDSVRGTNLRLRPNTSGSEINQQFISFNANGFQPTDSDGEINRSGNTYIYCAIRAE